MSKQFRFVTMVLVCIVSVAASGCVEPGCISFDVPEDGVLWAVTSDSDEGGDVILAISLSGTTIESVEVQTGDTTCGGSDGSSINGTVDFDGNQIQLSATVGDVDDDGVLTDGGCTIVLSGTIASCGNATSLLSGVVTDIFPLDGQGTVTLGGVEYSIANVDLIVIRMPEPILCEESFDSLEEMNWRLTNEDPFVLGSPGETVGLNAGGFENSVDGLEVFGSLTPDDPNSSFSCFGVVSASEIFFDGQEFRLHVQTEAGGDFEACTLDLEGQVTACENAPPGFSEVPSQAFQLSGAAIVTQGDLQAEFIDPFLALSQQELISFPQR